MREKTKVLLRLIYRPLVLLVYFVSGFVPRNASLWVFGSWNGRRFADNSKWLYIHCHQNPTKGVRAVWISKDLRLVKQVRARGLPALYAFSPRGLFTCLTAGVYVFDCYVSDVNYWTSRNAFLVNLWHGVPLKKIERDIDMTTHNYYKGFYGSWLDRLKFWAWAPWVYVRSDMMVSTSALVTRILSSAFGVNEDRIPVVGLPRNDAMLRQIDADENVGQLSEALGGKRTVIAYMPTFRDVAQRIPIDWKRLDEFLARSNATFLVKPHPHNRATYPPLGQLRNIREVPKEVDIYPLLSAVDILVTDYSSIYIDFLLTRRPVVFFVYDYQQYLKEMRSLYFAYEQVTPGPKARNEDELLSALASLLHDSTHFVPEVDAQYRETLNLFHAQQDNGASDRAFREILARAEDHYQRRVA